LESKQPPLPLVSFLVPAYNHEGFVISCLESIKADPYPRKELLVLDDGSGDQTFEKVAHWLEAEGHAFERVEASKQANQGICATLNELIARAEGEFILPLASDDEVIPGTVEGRVRFLQENSEIWVVYGDSRLMDEQGQEIGASLIRGMGTPANTQALLDPRLIALELILRWSGCGPALMVRRTCFSQDGCGPFDPAIFFEDREFFLRVAARRRLRYLDQAFGRYRVRQQSMCRSRENSIRMEQGMLLSEARNRRAFSSWERLALETSIWSRRLRLRGGLARWVGAVLRRAVFTPLQLAVDLLARRAA